MWRLRHIGQAHNLFTDCERGGRDHALFSKSNFHDDMISSYSSGEASRPANIKRPGDYRAIVTAAVYNMYQACESSHITI